MAMEESEVVMEIPQGKLRGAKKRTLFGTDYYAFHRIPYAKAPVGKLRFQPPSPGCGWTGIRDAREEGPVCPSVDFESGSFLKNSSEDSLFVNVFCRKSPISPGGKKCPVLVWIHGGGFEVGSGNKQMCGPDFFMLHDVILVTFNYRLGVLGFLSLETPECPGNFGLKDQQLALKWVKGNIEHFGGDPNNVTLFGISAGGASVHYQLLSRSSAGLFKRAIIQSGSALNRWAYSRRPRENAFALGKRLGCDTKDEKVLLDFFRKAPVEDLVVKGLRVIEDTEGKALGEAVLNFTFVPSKEPKHEGAMFTEHPWVLMKEGKYLDVPLILGIVTKEMIAGVTSVDDYPRFSKVEEYQELIPRDIRLPKNGEKSLALAKKIKEFFFQNGINLDNYINFLSDNFFNYGVYKIAERNKTNASHKSPTYLYQFTYEGDQPFLKQMLGLQAIKGACHGDDTCYLFRTDMTKESKMVPGTKDHEFMKKFTALWVSYATTGIPKLDSVSGFRWQETSAGNLEYLEICESPAMKKELLKERMKFWDEVYSSYYN